MGLYAEYAEGSPEVKRAALRRLGDVCLMVTGFFPDSLNKKIVDIDYYSDMGGAAYWQLSQSPASHSPYEEPAQNFGRFLTSLGS